MKAQSLCVLALILLAAPAAGDVEIHGVLSTGDHNALVDSVVFQFGSAQTFPTPGWGGGPSVLDTFDFPPAPSWPLFAVVFGDVDGEPVLVPCMPLVADTWYLFGPSVPEEARLLFWETSGIEETAGLPLRPASATASPTVTSGRVVFACAGAGPGPVRLTISDIAGRPVRTLAIRADRTGAASFAWDGRDDRDAPVPDGVYICRFETPGARAVTRALLAR